jgi:subtilisin family serine protease
MDNNLTLEQQAQLPLKEFIALPSTVDFTILKNPKLMDYIKDKPYIKLGKELVTGYVIAYTNKIFLLKIFEYFGSDFIHFFPFFMTTVDNNCNYATGISEVQDLPLINLFGQGVIIGFVDTGIDYKKDAFKNKNGTSRIKYICDQTIKNGVKEEYPFGRVYSQDEINKALSTDDPYSIVPSVDEIGHGTFLASVACGSENNGYTGVAPMSDIICVKLKNMNEYYLRGYNLLDEFEPIPDNINTNSIYNSNDVIIGIDFIINKANELNKPVVICIGVGGNYGYHNGSTLIEEYISAQCESIGVVIVTAAGNESNAAHHTEGKLKKTDDIKNIKVEVSYKDTIFRCFIWTSNIEKFTVSVKSPTGETLEGVPFKSGTNYFKFNNENSIIAITYYRGEQNLVIVSIRTSTIGTWKITLFGDFIITGKYDAWLQITGLTIAETRFLEPIPNKTIVIPATAIRSITCGAYDCNDGKLFDSSSWGPTNYPRYSPDFVAPGVNVKGIYPTGYGTMSGTSVSAAITSGAAALLLQWGIVEGNDISMNCDKVKSIIISGCIREENISYPNDQWGFGKLNLFNSFKLIK